MARRSIFGVLLFGGLASMIAGCTLLNTRADLIGGDGSGEPGGGDGGASSSDGTTSGSHDGASTRPDGGSLTDAASADDSSSPRADAADGDVAAQSGPVPIYTGLLVPGGITIHGDRVCWVASQVPRGLFCAPSAGGAASSVKPVDISSDLSFLDDAFDIAMDDTTVYWSNGKNNQIVRRVLIGGTAEQYFTGGGRLSYITLEGTTLFASDYSDTATAPGEVLYGPAGGGVSSVVSYTGQPKAAGVAHADTTLYWGTGNPNQLNFGPEHGNAAVTTIPMEGAVTGVAIDAQKTVYFIVGDQKVYRLVHGSTQPKMIYDAGSSFGTSDIAVDDNAVYWSERDPGRIMRMLK